MTEETTTSNSKPGGFLTELRRRRVLPFAGAYIAIAWLMTEIASYFLGQAGAPPWSFRLLAIVFMVGFPVTVVLAWMIQVGLDGKRSLDSSKGQHKTVIGAILLGVAATAGLAWLILPRIEDAPAAPGYDPMPNSVAVLPFLNPDATPHEITIGETLYTALTDGLNASDVVQVVLRLKKLPPDVVDYGRSVRVANLLTGRVLRSAGTTSIELTLLDVGSGQTHWTKKFDWDPTGIKELGTEISNDVLQSLDLPTISTKRFAGTDSREAYDAFLLGEQHQATFKIADLRTAIDDFQRAIDLDPDYVQARVGLAETIGWYLRYSGPAKTERGPLLKRLENALQTAQALEPESPDVTSALGFFTSRKDPVLGTQAIEHALEIDPNHAKSYHRLGRIAERKNQPSEAERLTRKALSLDPLNADWHNDLAGVLYRTGRYDEALAEVRRSTELEPDLPWNYHKLAFWHGIDFGRLDEAIIYARLAYALDPESGMVTEYVAGWYTDLGAKEEALAWTERQLELSPGNPGVWFSAGYSLTYLGEETAAREHLERALEMNPGNPWVLRTMTLLDNDEEGKERLLQHWEQAYPEFTNPESLVVDASKLDGAQMFAELLLSLGKRELAERLLTDSQEVLKHMAQKSIVREPFLSEIQAQLYAALGLKDETLEALRRQIIDGNWRATPIWYGLHIFDFIRDDPEFQELMSIVHTDLAEQQKRVRVMECNGELPPAPGIELVQVCD